MKKSAILKLFSLVTFAAAGAFAIANVKSSKKAESTEASGTYTIYCTKSRSELNDAISVHQWGGTTPGTEWGSFTAMTKVYDNSLGQPVFKLDIPSDRTGIIFIAWEGSALKQTFNIETGIANNAAWYFGDYAQDGDTWKMQVGTWNIYPYTINYHGNGSTSGSMASELGYDDVDWGLTSNSFVKTGSVFNGWNTKADGTGTAYSNSALVTANTMSTASSTTLDLYAQWRPTYTDGEYVIGKFGSCDWDIADAVLMDTNKSKDPWEFTKTVTFAYGDAFKLAYWTDSSSSLADYLGYSELIPTCGAFKYFGNDTADGNIVCYARGTYDIYSQKDSYGDGYSISIELNSECALNAEHLAAKLMGAGNTPGQCEALFSDMKEIFLGLSPTEQVAFIAYENSEEDQFKDAYLRYVAWAAHLHQKPWEEGEIAPSQYVVSSTDSNNLIVIVSIVSLISASTLVGLIVIKRRRGIAK